MLVATALWMAGAVASATADSFPDRPIKIIAPFTPGSPNDVVARLIAAPMATHLGQSVVVDNRPGGGTTIGVKAVMSAEPDGYTLLISNSPTHFISPLVNKSLSYDPLKDFETIATIASGGLMLVIAADVPAKTLAEFIAYAKANPGKLNFGFGQGTLPQLVGEMFKRASGTDIANIPYKGGAQAVTDMLGGRVQMNIGTISTLAPLVREGKLRALAVTSAARNHELPDVPTMTECGLPEVASVTYYGLLGPHGVPADAVRRINAAVNDSLKSPDVVAALRRIGFEEGILVEGDADGVAPSSCLAHIRAHSDSAFGEVLPTDPLLLLEGVEEGRGRSLLDLAADDRDAPAQVAVHRDRRRGGPRGAPGTAEHGPRLPYRHGASRCAIGRAGRAAGDLLLRAGLDVLAAAGAVAGVVAAPQPATG